MANKLVEFVADSFPHCLGDVVRLSDDELKGIKKDAYKDLDLVDRADKAQEAEIVEEKGKK